MIVFPFLCYTKINYFKFTVKFVEIKTFIVSTYSSISLSRNMPKKMEKKQKPGKNPEKTAKKSCVQLNLQSVSLSVKNATVTEKNYSAQVAPILKHIRVPQISHMN